MPSSYTETLAAFAVRTSFTDLPGDVVHATKRLILDTIGDAVGGFSTDIGKIAIDFKRDLGGRPESTILVVGEKTSCTSAAFANAALANALDADENIFHLGHMAQCAVMPALAVTERLGASGKDMITAVALGYELAGRIGDACKLAVLDQDGKIHRAKYNGLNWNIFAAVTGAGKLLGLDESKMANALGIAGYSTPVPVAGKWLSSPRPHTKYAFYPLMAESGTAAALLAARGFTGDRQILDGDLGWWRMAGALDCDWDALTGNLGGRWTVTEASFKPYPAQRYTHSYLDLLCKIMQENRLQRDEIESVDVEVVALMFTRHVDEFTVASEFDGEFSLPYLMAVAASGVRPGPEWHAAYYWNDPAIISFARKVKVHPNPAEEQIQLGEVAGRGRKKKSPATVQVKARGQVFKASTEYAKGDPWLSETVMTDEDLNNKFRNFCTRGIATARIERALDILSKLEQLDSVSDLIACLK